MDSENKQPFSMDNGLKKVLNSISYNVPKDWDSVIIVSGDGMVRVGKSVLAQQIAWYLAHKLNTQFTVDNIVFSGKELIEKAKTYPKYSVFIYDEARGELDTKKVMQEITKSLLDFFAECGMYNHIIILVLPDFFDLPKGIAISRSELLLNVYRKVERKQDKDGSDVMQFERGFFHGYHRYSKKKLYILGKKDFNNYDVIKRDFVGGFPNIFTIDKKQYEDKKKAYLAREREKEEKDDRFNIVLTALCKHISAAEAERELRLLGLKISNDTIMRHIRQIPKEIT